MDKRNVLIVDDADVVLESTADYLEMEYNILTATNGMDAWKILSSNEVDCLITDINMPVMDGYELLRKMKESKCHVKTIVVSGTSGKFEDGRLSEVDIDGFFVKPYFVKDLSDKIKTLLG